ncbi:ABC transporter permease subunit [Glaciihabitans sp. dw_435]|uniref:ABC transporter permease n=1 Tax=Glaciihabitans sp. dw_435 TaxID=2720081 RepID=UPI0027DCEE81|nr:ABC transporter permease subunit [Glaciihabitans sp. dw_435]
MSQFFSGVGVIFALEMRQRVRGLAWYILLGVFVVLIAIVTVLLSLTLSAVSDVDGNQNAGAQIFSTIIYFVLLLGTLVAPALSGNSINGDRDAGTLATTQITLVSTWQIIIGKFLAAWTIALAFLAASVPFLLYATLAGGLAFDTIVVSILVLAFELGVVAAIGVGLSGIINRGLFSIVLTYLVVAALSVGTLITFGLGALASQVEVTHTDSYMIYDDAGNSTGKCEEPSVYTENQPQFDRFWGVLVANPYVLLADAVPTHYDRNGNPTDLFGSIKYGERMSQLPVNTHPVTNECVATPSPLTSGQDPAPRALIDSTTPGWFVGILIHLVLAAAALVGAWARLRTPAGRLTKGSRIA